MQPSEEVDINEALHRAFVVRLRSVQRACDGLLTLLEEYTFSADDVANGYAVAKQVDEALCEVWGNADAGCLARCDEHIARFLVDGCEEDVTS